MMMVLNQLYAISNFSSWDVGAGKELEEDALILPRPNTVLKVKMTFRNENSKSKMSRLWT